MKQYGVGKDTVTQAVVQSGQRMRRARVNENQREQIRRLHDEGQTPKAIAVTTGLNLGSSVRRVLHSSAAAGPPCNHFVRRVPQTIDSLDKAIWARRQSAPLVQAVHGLQLPSCASTGLAAVGFRT